ncbi:MAG: HEAT repeat domain-containing protein [Candidatus Hermodarchaeota archaeon]
MDTSLDLESIQDVLIQAIDQDPDLQVKAIIATQLAQRNSFLLLQKLISLSRSPKPAVREVIAAALEGQVEVLDDLLNWYVREKNGVVIDKLYTTIAASLKLVPNDYDFSSIIIKLKPITQEDQKINYSLELIGYCPVPETIEFLSQSLHIYRFHDGIRESIMRGFHQFTQKTRILPEKIQETIASIITAPYEPEMLRKASLDVLGEIDSQQVFDLIELILETDHSPILRKRAIEIASKWGVTDLSLLIIEKLNFDGISDVRRAAAVALGNMACFEALPDLAESLENDPSFFVREAAAEALGVLKSQQAIMSLLKGLEDHDSYVREVSAWSIEQLEPNLDMILVICRAANSLETDLKIKEGMVSLIGRLSSTSIAAVAANCLLQMLEKDKTPLRELILEALENYVTILKTDEDFLEIHLPHILNILSNSSSFSLRAAACTFLGHLKNSTTFTFLLDRLLYDSDPFVQRQAAWAISKLSSIEYTPRIIEIMKDKKFLANLPFFLDILTSWPRLSDLPLAMSYINSEASIEIRQQAVEWITAIVSSDLDLYNEMTDAVLKALIHILKNDKANTVRAASAHALGHFHYPEYDSIINSALITAIKEDRIYSVRELAAEALGFRGGISAIKDLKQLINHTIEKDPSIRYFASIALLNVEIQLTKRNLAI